jgi:hypothetical protein
MDGKMVSETMDASKPGSCFSEESVKSGFVDGMGLGVVGTAPGSDACLQKLKDLVMMKQSTSKQTFLGSPTSVAAYLDFPDWTRYLGAAELYDLCGSPAADRAMLSWSYDSMVPCYKLTRQTRNLMRASQHRFLAVTDPEIFYYKDLTDGIPGFIQQMDDMHGSDNWQFIALMLQWGQTSDSVELYQVHRRHDS